MNTPEATNPSSSSSSNGSRPWVRRILNAHSFTPKVPIPKLPPFPFVEMQQALCEAFSLKTCKLEVYDSCSNEKQDLFQDRENQYLTLILSPLSQPLTLILSSHDLNQIIQVLSSSQEPLSFADQDLQQAFMHFIMAKFLNCFSQLSFLPGISPQFHMASAPPPQEPHASTIKIHCAFNDQSFYPHLHLPSDFLTSLTSFTAMHKLKAPPPPADIPVSVRVEVGHVSLNYPQINSLQLGDFVVLDTCSYQPEKNKGRATLTLNEKPVFRLLYSKNTIKLLDYPIFQEDLSPMDDSQQPFNDDDMIPEDELKLPDDLPPLDESDLLSQDIPQAPEDSVSSLDEDSQENERQEEEPDDQEGDQESMEETELENSQAVEEPPTPLNPHAPLVSAQDLSLELKVEVTTLQMTLHELMELQPGSTLELDTLPQDGVSLVHQGKALARGQLIQIGDMVGVKIIELKS